MIFLLLPFIFNPFSFIIRWLPALYLAAWPIIIQTLGRDALMTQALLLVIFILTSDITRETMLKLIGFDLISLPVSVAVLAVLMSGKGAYYLNAITPLIGEALVIVEPLLLIMETFIIMNMIECFNRWMSKLANIRDESSQDLSSWEPPLTRGSILMRFVVILVTISSYMATYLIIQEAKTLFGASEVGAPVQFYQAIAILMSLQLCAMTATFIKENGIISESANVVLVASIPIFIASWSYYNLKLTSSSSSFNWTSYFPFNLLSGGSASDNQQSQFGIDPSGRISFGGGRRRHQDASLSPNLIGRASPFGLDEQVDFGALEGSLGSLLGSSGAGQDDGLVRHFLLATLRRLIMIINSILGLSMDQLAKYYFGPEFWYILAGRLVCLGWWTLFGMRRSQTNDGHDHDDDVADNLEEAQNRFRSMWARLQRLPVKKSTLFKVLIVLAYAQMLVQQMENKHVLMAHLLGDEQQQQQQASAVAAAIGGGGGGGCCAGHPSEQSMSSAGAAGGIELAGDTVAVSMSAPFQGLIRWFTCVWNSARACSSSSSSSSSSSVWSPSHQPDQLRSPSWFNWTLEAPLRLLASLAQVVVYLFTRLIHLRLSLHSIYVTWLVRWRSPIIQRLIQSIFVQMYYLIARCLPDPSDDHHRVDF